MANYKKFIRNMLFFREPEKTEKFILKESDQEKGSKTQKRKSRKTSKNKDDKEEKKLDGKEEKKLEVSRTLSENLEYVKKRYSIPVNGDVILREFDITVRDKVIGAFLFFFDGMVDRKIVNSNILGSLMLLSNLDIKAVGKDTASYVRSRLIMHNQLKEFKEYDKVFYEVNFGGCAIFIDGIDTAFTADVKGWEHRIVDRPNTELLIRGPQEGFTEVLRVNTALVRKILKDEDLMVENILICKRSKTPCSMMYIKDITNESLVNEVRRRLNSIKADYIIDSGELEQMLEDDTYLPAPQILATERPDRVAAHLSEGKVAVIMHGSPYALIMPANFVGLIHSPEDSYIRFPYGNFLRFIRALAIVFALLLPGLYVAVTSFHQEMIPTDLLLAIESSRERVPFPSVVEILIMEISFELIREAGIRIPGPIGPTLGIIGALILGQAAVAANIVSPILIIIVAVTGIGSFAIPNFSLSFAFRMLRFAYIILGAMAGLLGITTGLFIQGLWFASTKSFGVPFLAPFAPMTRGILTDEITRAPIWKQEIRPDFLNVKSVRKQPHISRGWVRKKSGGDNDSRKQNNHR